ncbi:hypothetical protein E4U53_006282 [Claviceps sorghi]|nr:hypothetical protein E4U53_006282 [Claviceps sorghi]
MAGSKGKVCLASQYDGADEETTSYSGGLDTSTILAWLLEQQYEVVSVTAHFDCKLVRNPTY